MSNSDLSDPNPENPLSGNNTDSSDDVAMRDENAVPTDEDADCFFCHGKYSDEKGGKKEYSAKSSYGDQKAHFESSIKYLKLIKTYNRCMASGVMRPWTIGSKVYS
ncbi:hypothetical protein HHI36_010495 [Cryptolaemus montrouzieri]|uniref:Uncharacterized protein n=1 Tax=Cryptolaemus montrouzieri TaxID=559131 RepID=A0ABD2MIX4_9CUCU